MAGDPNPGGESEQPLEVDDDVLEGVFDEERSGENKPAIRLPPGLPPEVAAALAAAQADSKTSTPDDDAADDESLPDAGPNIAAMLGLGDEAKKRDWRRYLARSGCLW